MFFFCLHRELTWPELWKTRFKVNPEFPTGNYNSAVTFMCSHLVNTIILTFLEGSIRTGSSVLFPAEISSNSNQMHLNRLIKLFECGWKLKSGVMERIWNSTGKIPKSRTKRAGEKRQRMRKKENPIFFHPSAQTTAIWVSDSWTHTLSSCVMKMIQQHCWR